MNGNRINSGYYSVLTEEGNIKEDCQNQGSGPSSMEVVKKTPKPPPIIIPGSKLTDIQGHVAKATGLEHTVQYKITDSDTRIYVGSEKDFLLLKKFLSNRNVQYCTHPLRGDKKTKVCVYGLNEMDSATLMDELEKFGVAPAEIKMITPKNGHKGQSRIYILYYKKTQQVKISDLRSKITGLFHLRVSFQYYSPRKFGPTQCVRCQGLGHGAENCQLSFRCVTCAGEHDSKTCPARVKVQPTAANPNPKPKAPEEMVKCALCQENHTANYSKCAVRIRFSPIAKPPFKKLTRPQPNLSQQSFPPLPSRPINNWWNQDQNHRDEVPNAPWEMQAQLMQSFQKMQSEMLSMMQNMLQEVKSLIQVVSQSKSQSSK